MIFKYISFMWPWDGRSKMMEWMAPAQTASSAHRRPLEGRNGRTVQDEFSRIGVDLGKGGFSGAWLAGRRRLGGEPQIEPFEGAPVLRRRKR